MAGLGSSAVEVVDGLKVMDLARVSVREVNAFLHGDLGKAGVRRVQIANPGGRHNLAVGLDADVSVEILGHAGYFVAGMNKRANVTVVGNTGRSFAENIMSGVARVKGSTSESAGASGHGGLVVIEGDASSRCGISLKGADIVVGGNVGHASAFMAQAGRLVVCGNAGAGLGDSLYEAVIYVRGTIESLGADAREEDMSDADHAELAALLKKAGMSMSTKGWKRVASARTLYHWNADAGHSY
jgi:glutamate synthase domain-containing protein 3